jgi:hypothetical protein
MSNNIAKSLTPQFKKLKKPTSRPTKTGDHQHHHLWHFLLRACLAPSAPFHRSNFFFKLLQK